MILGRLGTELHCTQLPCGKLAGYYFPDDCVIGLLEDRVPVGNLDRDGRFQPYHEAANDAAAGLESA
jgi:hypothetical protein